MISGRSEKTGMKRPVKTASSEPANKIMKKSTIDLPGAVKPGHWTQGLKQALQNPKNIILETEKCSVIHDKYPKAKKHFLVIAKGDVSSMKSLNRSHVPLINEMIKIGRQLESTESDTNPSIRFRMGFHAVPSMTLLHMHVISTDFDSPSLKNKRHWNSFTTDFFRPANSILSELSEKGCITIDTLYYKQLLESSLKCHICNADLRNIPRLKEHVRTHFS
ncbi:aprataxin-like [Clytia hemisphaerica]|uniref:Aprataxin n=1 Tax=Clytia hemisphaerica TaxID=252671 RepID=A0A7M5VEX3_9CNID